MAHEVYIYNTISRNEDFREFMNDILVRMGLTEKDLMLLFSDKNREINYGEFAKCFVTKNADPNYNYEVYELAGDVCLNNSIVMYLLSNINSAQEQRKKRDPYFKPSPMLTDYFNKLKAYYISKFYFTDVYHQLGFHKFLVKGERTPNIDQSKCYSDSFEAFVGCFEVLCDRHLDDHYSHRYVSNFIKYIFNMKRINYDPSLIYEPITLLKETNDTFKRKYQFKYLVKNTGGPQNQSTTLHFIRGTSNDKDYDVYGTNKSMIISDLVPPMHGNMKNNNEDMSRNVLKYLYTIASGLYVPDRNAPDFGVSVNIEDIKLAPTPELLGIKDLI